MANSSGLYKSGHLHGVLLKLLPVNDAMVVLLDGFVYNGPLPIPVCLKHPIRISDGHFIAAPPNQTELAGGEPEELRNGDYTSPDDDGCQISIDTQQLVPRVYNGLLKLCYIRAAKVDVQDSDALVEIDAVEERD